MGAQSTSYRGGVVKFDGTNWQLFDHHNSTMYDGETALVRIDDLNNIWVVSDTASGYGYYASNLSKFNGSSWTEYFSSNSCFQLHHSVHDIDFDSENVLWIAAGNESGSINKAACGLIRFDEATFEIWNRDNMTRCDHRKFDLNCNLIYQDSSSTFSSEDAVSIVVDNEDVKWLSFAPDASGVQPSVWSFDGARFTKWDHTNSVFNNYGSPGLDLDWEDNIWVVYSGHRSLYKSQCNKVISDINYLTIENNIVDIYPNPAKTTFTIKTNTELKHPLIKLFNSMGVETFSEYISGNSITIGNNLPSGLYFVFIIDGLQNWTAKVVKNQ